MILTKRITLTILLMLLAGIMPSSCGSSSAIKESMVQVWSPLPNNALGEPLLSALKAA